MANDFTQNPYVIDTVMAVAASWPVKVKTVRWASGLVVGHAVEVVSTKSNIIWRSTASVANYVEAELLERWWFDGFRVKTLDSGVIFITYE